LGGTFDSFQQQEVSQYLAAQGLPTPQINVIGSSDFQNGNPNTEVMLDIEVLASVLPYATFNIYFENNDDRGFVDLVKDASLGSAAPPSILSLSWGGPDLSQSAMYTRAMNEAILDATSIGTTLFAAAGDNGSADDVQDGYTFATFPAASPYAVAVGGTSLSVS